MRQRVRRFGVGQTAKVAGVLYALMGLVAVPIFLVATLVAPSEAEVGLGIGFALLLPLLYGLLGFVFTAIGCIIYNLVAGWVGGIEVDFGDSAA
jgi:hypothetical protein